MTVPFALNFDPGDVDDGSCTDPSYFQTMMGD